MGLEKINEYKKAMGLTTEELSEKSGIPIGTLNKLLSGATKDPKLETIKSIARVLGLTLNDFDDESPENMIQASEKKIIDRYRSLDAHGKEMVDFTIAKEWERSTNKIEQMPNAAHEIKGSNIYDKKHDDKIMDDPKEWN